MYNLFVMKLKKKKQKKHVFLNKMKNERDCDYNI